MRRALDTWSVRRLGTSARSIKICNAHNKPKNPQKSAQQQPS